MRLLGCACGLRKGDRGVELCEHVTFGLTRGWVCAQPTHMGSGAIHAGQTANEKRWGQMGQPSGSSGYGRGHGEQGFNIKGDGTDLIGGDTHGVARLTPTETAQAVAEARNMPIFNSRAGCADRGET